MCQGSGVSHEQLFCGLWGMEGATPQIIMVHFLKAANLFFCYRVFPTMDKVNMVWFSLEQYSTRF